ncbi:MAG: hypothetical protein J2P17_21075 [Mycobacterium sp.]|nr:hypothetical protein [Mycobacterium sp.]
MSAVIVVSLVWFGVIAFASFTLIGSAARLGTPRWFARLRTRYYLAVDGAMAGVGRVGTAATVFLAGWALLIIVGCLLGELAHRLQGVVDEPVFTWWQDHHLGGTWSDVWWQLTNIGMPRLDQGITLGAAIVFAVLYAQRGRRFWWAPSATIILGYLAEKYGQMICKAIVNRGHPPTRAGTWPSGGMARTIIVFGLVFFFLIMLYAPSNKRAWAIGASLLGLCASIQAYARINNLEHWVTDVVGGGIWGLLGLFLIITGYCALARDRVAASAETQLEPSARL